MPRGLLAGIDRLLERVGGWNGRLSLGGNKLEVRQKRTRGLADGLGESWLEGIDRSDLRLLAKEELDRLPFHVRSCW